MKPVANEILIAAPPQRVFDVITDLDRYPEWNRFTPRISLATSELRVGAEVDVDCQMTDTSLLRGEREVILGLDRERLVFSMGTSRIRGRPGITSERVQRCEAHPAGTRFVNAEQFTGPLAPLVYLLYARKLQAAVQRYCADLKLRAERPDQLVVYLKADSGT
jgi:uncharacterized protein YndB with AHSA1/START domain